MDRQDHPQSIALDTNLISAGLDCLGKHPFTFQHCFLRCRVNGANISNIEAIAGFKNLQHVDFKNNLVEDLSPLSKLPHLVTLNASQNCLTTALEFGDESDIGSQLAEADLSLNLISHLPSLSQHQYLRKLILDNNLLTAITGLSDLHHLEVLSLASNEITEIDGLFGLPIRHLYLQRNKITRLENLEQVPHLQTLHLGENRIRTIWGVHFCRALRFLDLANNGVEAVSELDTLTTLPLLSRLELTGNPVQQAKLFRWRALFRLQQLAWFDGEVVSAREKVKAMNAHGVDREHRLQVHSSRLPAEEFRQGQEPIPTGGVWEAEEEEELRGGMPQQPPTYRAGRKLGGRYLILEVRYRADDGAYSIRASEARGSAQFALVVGPAAAAQHARAWQGRRSDGGDGEEVKGSSGDGGSGGGGSGGGGGGGGGEEDAVLTPVTIAAILVERAQLVWEAAPQVRVGNEGGGHGTAGHHAAVVEDMAALGARLNIGMGVSGSPTHKHRPVHPGFRDGEGGGGEEELRLDAAEGPLELYGSDRAMAAAALRATGGSEEMAVPLSGPGVKLMLRVRHPPLHREGRRVGGRLVLMEVARSGDGRLVVSAYSPDTAVIAEQRVSLDKAEELVRGAASAAQQTAQAAQAAAANATPLSLKDCTPETDMALKALCKELVCLAELEQRGQDVVPILTLRRSDR